MSMFYFNSMQTKKRTTMSSSSAFKVLSSASKLALPYKMNS